jgi:hypothetical protein
VLAAVALPPDAPADAAAAALVDKQAAEEWAQMQSDAPLRQLTVAKALAVLRRNRPEWMHEELWTPSLPVAAKQLEALMYGAASSVEMYTACTLNDRLLESCHTLTHTLQSNATVVAAAAQYLLPELSDDDDTSDTDSDADAYSTEHTVACAASSAAVQSRVLDDVERLVDSRSQRQQQQQQRQQQCEQLDSTDLEADVAGERTVSTVDVATAVAAPAAVAATAAVVEASCTQQAASTIQIAVAYERQQ